MTKLVEVRCPLPDKTMPKKLCNHLCVRVQAGSAGKAYCPRHKVEFDFQVDDNRSFGSL